MKKLIIDLEHCYGIRKVKYEFDFENTGNVFAVYAPNGVMKTSFANTFKDLSLNKDSLDRIQPSNETKRIIQDQDATSLLPESIFVVEPYNEKYRSDQISTLLVNDELRNEYDDLNKEIESKSEILIKELKKHSGLKADIKEEIADSIVLEPNPDEFLLALSRIRREVEESSETLLGEVKYTDIFNTKVEALFKDETFVSKLNEYIAKYEELVSRSTFFRKGVFTHNNAADIAKNLQSNGYFQADHSMYLCINGEKKEIATLAELEEAIQQEKDTILTDSELMKAFESMDTILNKNIDHKKFRACLENNQIVLSELKNRARLRQKLWGEYLIRSKDSYIELLDTFENVKDRIKIIIEQAKADKTKWADVISIFNERFSVPFVVTMRNKENVILKDAEPILHFDFLDKNDDGDPLPLPIEEEKLIKVLSNGEQRALYLLNIIFEVRARAEKGQQTLFIIDDIADSFDYKNKYAIIEYLKEVSEELNFKQIILSHNFDFFRTVSGRLNLQRSARLLASKENYSVILSEEIYQNSPFKHWCNHLDNDVMLIASIPFFRNLAEFSGNDDNYRMLTSLLHIKENTNDFTVSELETLIKDSLHNAGHVALNNSTETVVNIIYSTAERLSLSDTETAALEDKIVLSIAIRLKAEQFMIDKISDIDFSNNISKNQTVQLIKKFKSTFSDQKECCDLLDQVNLMTPENIHLNSFMYEPILDLSAHHLKKLYRKVCALLAQSNV